MNNLINIYGETGVGKSTLIKDFELDNISLIIDFQDALVYKEVKKRCILNESQSRENCLKLLNSVSSDNKYVFFENFTHLFPLIKNEIHDLLINNKQTFFALVTFNKLNTDYKTAKYLEIKYNSLFKNNKQILMDLMQ